MGIGDVGQFDCLWGITTGMSEKRPRWERAILAVVGILVVMNILSRPFRGPNPAYDLGAVIDALLTGLVFDPGLFGLAFWMLVAFVIGQEWQAWKDAEREYRGDEFYCENCGDAYPDRGIYYVDSETSDGEEEWCPHCVINNNIRVEST